MDEFLALIADCEFAGYVGGNCYSWGHWDVDEEGDSVFVFGAVPEDEDDPCWSAYNDAPDEEDMCQQWLDEIA